MTAQTTSPVTTALAHEALNRNSKHSKDHKPLSFTATPQAKPAVSPVPAQGLPHPARPCFHHHHSIVYRPGRYQGAVRGHGHGINRL